MTAVKINNIRNKTEEELDQIFEQAFNNKITELDLSSNSLIELSTNLTVNITVLKTLRKLNLSHNELTTLPAYLAELPCLDEIVVADNPLISPPKKVVQAGTRAILEHFREPTTEEELLRIITKADKEKVKVLDLNRRGIVRLPKEIGLLSGLEVLKLRQNSISSLPAEFSQLLNLKRLELGDNKFSSFPEEITQLPRLEILDLGANSLTCLPPEIRHMSNLRQLDLSANELVSLPSEMGKLKNLRILFLCFNSLTSLSKEIALLENLEELDLSHNQLRSLLKEIARLTKLKELSLCFNKLTSLPVEELSRMESLKEIFLQENKLDLSEKEWDQLKRGRVVRL